MVCPRKTVPVNPPEPDLAIVVANLQRQLREQQQETDRLREKLARMNQRPHVHEVPPPVHQIPPVVPPVPEVQPEVQPEVPIAPTGVQINPPLVILDFMRLTEQEKVICVSFALKKDARHWWMTVQMRRDVTTMNISKQVSAGSSPPTLVSDCVSQAIRAEYWINQDKEARAQIFKARKEEKVVVKQTQPRPNVESFPKGQSSNPAQSSKQFGRNKRKGNFTSQGQQRNYPQKRNNRGNEDLIAIKLQDFDVILGMDFLGDRLPKAFRDVQPSR
ncbi:hypothetical protein TIFTF001_016372 [Ficus carica]|uniref:Uncharacterized protein n=1 Tax=Ficus carica TaxID=3494 RepID=A0AA88D9U1_FICCA|nr:hypothetical protein TIFTF001_016372 [Ficus carica]